MQRIPTPQLPWSLDSASFWLGLWLEEQFKQKSEIGISLRVYCKTILMHRHGYCLISHSSAFTVFLNECLTFVVVLLCVHPVETVKEPIDLCLYQSQLLFNHLQFFHPHCGERTRKTLGDRGNHRSRKCLYLKFEQVIHWEQHKWLLWIIINNNDLQV